MIQVIRKDYPARHWIDRKGRERSEPAFYNCSYRWEGKEIATYSSRDDIVYLRGDYLSHRDPTKTDYERALESKINEGFREFFFMLGIDEKTRLS